MPTTLTRFRVEDLHGSRTIDIPIRDNRLIIVGENGTGKSTVANLIYFLLTRQWSRLREFRFAAIAAEIGGHEVRVTPEQIDVFRARRTHATARVHPSMRRALFRSMSERHMEEMLESPEMLEHFAMEYGLSPRVFREMVREYYEESAQSSPELHATSQILADVVTDQLLYLPTYRRIEQDLKSIFRGAEVEAELRQFRERLSQSRSEASYIELVEFGMQDVERTLLSRLTQLKENVRNGLNNLTGTYLRDVIRGRYSLFTDANIAALEPSTMDALLARMDEAVLPSNDKARLRERIRAILERGTVASEDKLVLHFLTLLLDLHNKQLKDERDVREFVRICNEYLVGKQLVYDNVNFSVSIQPVLGRGEQAANAIEGTEKLELKMLSSGEKQIVSLFAHVYLSGRPSFFMVIDEPELSLSVPWQRRFLPDILGTGKCEGLISVTHSPFIWENELEPYVHSLAEYTEPANVVR